jgi:mono/diheme cytochrome c family protein
MKLNIVITIGTLLLAGAAVGAEDGGALYKKRCAGCHGANGEGKPAMKAPALKGTKLEATQITDQLMKGGSTKAPHNKAMPGLKEDQAKAVAEYVKTL